MYQNRGRPLLVVMQMYSQTVTDLTLTQAVADELKELRRTKGYTQQELAAMSGIPRVSIQRYESGKSIKIEDLGTLVTALGGDPGVLFAAAVARVYRKD